MDRAVRKANTLCNAFITAYYERLKESKQRIEITADGGAVHQGFTCKKIIEEMCAGLNGKLYAISIDCSNYDYVARSGSIDIDSEGLKVILAASGMPSGIIADMLSLKGSASFSNEMRSEKSVKTKIKCRSYITKSEDGHYDPHVCIMHAHERKYGISVKILSLMGITASSVGSTVVLNKTGINRSDFMNIEPDDPLYQRVIKIVMIDLGLNAEKCQLLCEELARKTAIAEEIKEREKRIEKTDDTVSVKPERVAVPNDEVFELIKEYKKRPNKKIVRKIEKIQSKLEQREAWTVNNTVVAVGMREGILNEGPISHKYKKYNVKIDEEDDEIAKRKSKKKSDGTEREQ